MGIEFPVVGVGASAGGLEALEKFFDGLPPELSAAFIVVQHLSPDHKSLMADLLSKHTRMPVHEAVDGQEIAVGSVTMVPPFANLAIENRKLVFRDRAGHSPNLPINLLFTSLAESFGERAVGVVLSGTGSDGREGIMRIKQAGGLVIAQDPGSARFDGMPLAAIASGAVDLVLTPEAMGRELLVARTEDETQLDTVDEPSLQAIHRRLHTSTGIDFSEYKPATLLRRIAHRMATIGVPSLPEYARRIELDPAEPERLSKELLINVTQFFRDEDVFDALLKQVLKPLAQRATVDPVRVWVPGCSTGQEAYTLAMLLAEERPRSGYKIFATDLDHDALEIAARGVFTEQEISSVPEVLRARYFRRVGDQWEVERDLRRHIVFAPHNVARDPPFTRLDLVSCRNVLIYLSPALQRRVLGTFAFALKTDGHLLLGTSESLGDQSARFAAVNGRLKLYQRLEGPRLLATEASVLTERVAGPPSEAQQAIEAATRLLLDRVVPAAVLTNDRLEVLRVFGNAERLLALPAGTASLALPGLVPASLTTVTTLVSHRALATSASAYIAAGDAEGTGVNAVRAQPFTVGRSASRYLIISFERALAPVSPGEGVPADTSGTTAHLGELQRELLFVRESLQATIEELETSNEELQATNEELLAANEELQSTNEELQSVNEELNTVNAEHQGKISELTEVNADLDNLFNATTVGTIFLDEELKLRRFTPAATQAFSLLERDLGRPIEHITHQFKGLHIVEDLNKVRHDAQLVERELVTANDHKFLMRISPYFTQARQVRGVVASFVDVTQLRSEQETRNRLQFVLDSLAEQVAVVDTAGKILFVNSAWNGFARENGGEDLGARLGVGSNYLAACKAVPEVRSGIEAVLMGSRERFDFEYPCHSPTQRRWFVMHVMRMRDGTGAVISHIDVTARRLLEEARS